MSSVTEVGDELYALSPADFTAARDDKAASLKRDGDTDLAAEVKRLRKPSATAWAVNQLVRHRRDEVEKLLELGASMREAQDDLDRDTLRTLTAQRRRVVAALAARAATLAADLGHRISASATTEIEQTLQAAMTDPDAAEAVRTGCLLRPLEATGFDPVDLGGALAIEGAGALRDGGPAAPRAAARAVSRSDAAARELAEATAKARETEAWAVEAESALDAVDRRLDDAATRRHALEQKEADLIRRLDELRAVIATLDDETGGLDSERDAAQRTARSARRSADRARDRAAYLS